MTRSLSQLVLAAGVVSLVVSGCTCRTGQGPIGQKGEIRIIFETDGVTVEGENGTYDFGQVPMGKAEPRKLVVRNTGLGVLSVIAFEKSSGVAVQLGTSVVEANPVFTLAYEPIEISPGETHEFDLTFTPPQDLVNKQVPHEAIILLRAENTEAGKDTSQITLKGVGVSGECDLPRTLDFGAVARGDTFAQSVTIKNTRPIDSLAFVGDIQSAQGEGVFTYTPESPRGEFTILSGKEKTVTINFLPTEARDYFANVTMRAADGCPDVRIRLIGTGVDSVLSWTPSTVDFGYVTPGLTVPGEVTFQNKALRAVALTGIVAVEGSNPSSVYKVTQANPGDLTKLTVPAATRDATGAIVDGTVKLTMSFRPTVLGPKQGVLRANTDLRTQATVAVPLRGFGGGPDIDVKPAPALNFGRVAYFAGANPASYATRKVSLQNVGTRPNPPDPRANLKLGAGGNGKPYWTVVPKNANSADAEICVGLFDVNTGTCANDLPATGPGAYDPAVGLEASGTRALLDIPIRVTPNGLGAKEWEVTFLSNDPDEPTFTITVQANAVQLPPCNYTVTPLNLNFGVVTPPNTKDLGFSVRNNATNAGDICLLSNLEMKAGSDAIFSLPAGAVAERELQPGETVQVLTRAWPQGQLPATPTAVTGQVVFNMSNPARPEATVNLTATLAPSCLTISPNALDFGTVQKDCNSPDRTFQIYNSCSQAVTINQFQMIAPAGEPAGGPNCPGTAACPEFFSVSTGGITPGTVIQPPSGSSAPVSFSLKYRPINYGPDTGAFLIKVTQAGQQVDYVVTLRGVGDTMGLNTDTFRQDSKPKADILLVIDNSCSMSDEQQLLATNFNSFIKYAVSSQVDFQIGVTTTDDDTGGEQGSLVPFPGSAAGCLATDCKIFRPTTPGLEQKFGGTVNLGINGSGWETCMSPAVKALTAPKITNPQENGGLLRMDAVLAVVCVSDAIDQAAQPASYYLNQLQNIKGAQRPGLFTYNVVGPFNGNPPSGCYYDGGADDGKHAYMVTQTNGVREEICTPDWAKALENIGKNAFGFRTNFFLTARPDGAADVDPNTPGTQSVIVAIDGTTLPPTDVRGARVWEYDSTNNSVNFEPLYVPEPGKTLTVTYRVACIP